MNAHAATIDLSLPRIEQRLSGHRPRAIAALGLRRSAVACVLRYQSSTPEVLLMKRAERDGDRWSGQVSFPGGREEEIDPDLQRTAMRETWEEVGMDLQRDGRYIGRLDTIRARGKGGFLPLTVTPFVFVQESEAPLRLNREASEAFWLPLDQAASGVLSDEYHYHAGPLPMKFPCWRYEGRVVWGLTYKMLDHLLDVTVR